MNKISINFGEDVATINLENRKIILQYAELSEISEIYQRFYIRESVENYLKEQEYSNNNTNIETAVSYIFEEVKCTMNDY